MSDKAKKSNVLMFPSPPPDDPSPAVNPAIEALILEHMDLVSRVAASVIRKMPASVEIDELVSIGNIGLVEAANRFDPSRHVCFAAYALWRIRGAMIDAYRGRNWPKIMESMPEGWLDIKATNTFRMPDSLIEPASALEELIVREQSGVVSIDAGRARRRLREVERRVFDLHVAGDSLREIGRKEGRSGAWAYYVVAGARRKMRKVLSQLDEAA